MLTNNLNKYDVVVVGSGIAGLSHILYLEQFFSDKSYKPSIALICKSNLNETNTYWAQGGIASVTLPSDHITNHIEDTMVAGDYLNKKDIVEKVAGSAPELIKQLVTWGVSFDKNEKGDLHTTKEGGHSHQRILHHKDETGKNIQRALMDQLPKNLTVFENHLAFNIHVDDEDAFHISILDEQEEPTQIISTYIVLATGGVGMLYENTTNTEITTGDGIFLANALGAACAQLSFVQFHPTGLYNPGKKSDLISEALRGEGALLRNLQGEPFMYKYDSRKELAPRDIVSRSIVKEMSLHNSNHVLLDGTMIPNHKWMDHFPNIYKSCMNIGIDPMHQPIPVIPVQHYLCGGIVTNEHGLTSVKNLYAIGEVANSGLHGSNRLASNSLLEGIALGKFSASHLSENFQINQTFPHQKFHPLQKIKSLNRKLLQKFMSESMGVLKFQEKLMKTAFEISQHINTAPFTEATKASIETNMMYTTAQLMISDAINQKKNTGVFFKVF